MSKPENPQPPSPSTAHPPRTHNQLTIFLTGATLLTLSTLLTRRSLLHRHRSIVPRFYHPSNVHPSLKINGRLEAYQALGLATINVASFFVMMGGGLLWAFDIGSVEELRRRAGGGRGVDGKWREGGRRDEGEEEFQKWVASLTGRRKEVKKEERRWSAREVGDEERAREDRYAVVEPRDTDKRGKSR